MTTRDVKTTAIFPATDKTHSCSRVDGHDAVVGGVQVTQVVALVSCAFCCRLFRFPPAVEEHLRRMRDLEERPNPSQSLAVHLSSSARNRNQASAHH